MNLVKENWLHWYKLISSTYLTRYKSLAKVHDNRIAFTSYDWCTPFATFVLIIQNAKQMGNMIQCIKSFQCDCNWWKTDNVISVHGWIVKLVTGILNCDTENTSFGSNTRPALYSVLSNFGNSNESL